MKLSMHTKNVETIVFGAGYRGREFVDFLLEKDIKPVCFFDNSMRLLGDNYRGIGIETPCYIKGAIVVIAVDVYYKEIYDQLIEIGYASNEIKVKEEFLIGLMSEEEKNHAENEIKQYPSVIQLPITFSCNFNCVMCGMSQLKKKRSVTSVQLKQILHDDYFSHVRSVGINGGEPFVRTDLTECLKVIVDELKELKDIYFISNGYFTDKMCLDLQIIHEIAASKGIMIHLTLSVDGVGEMQDFHRGKDGAFEHVNKTLGSLCEGVHYDVLDALCTITRFNIYKVNEVVAWASMNNLSISYDIAGENKRVANSEFFKDVSVFSDEHARQLAQEFFYKLFVDTGLEHYFATYLFLRHEKRYGLCPCRTLDWVTIYPDGQMGFCSTRSEELGHLCEMSGEIIKQNNLDELNRIISSYCESCPQNMGNLTAEGRIKLYNHIIHQKYIRM